MSDYAYESITVAGTAIGFTASVLDAAIARTGRPVKEVFCTAETAQMRCCDDGTTPTAAVGHLVNVGDTIKIKGEDAAKFRAIRVSSSGVLMCSFAV